jgi:uncharacterized protein
MLQSEIAVPHRHLPALTDANREFWQSGRDGRLRFWRCETCGLFIHPWAASCRRCHSRTMQIEPVSGRAIIKTFTINRHAWEPSLIRPFAIAIVGIVEQDGLNLMTNIVNCELRAITIGMPVKVVFEQVEDVWLPLFEPAGGGMA